MYIAAYYLLICLQITHTLFALPHQSVLMQAYKMKRMEIENSFRDLLFILNNTMINLASLKKNTKQSLSKSSKVICCFESMIIPSSSSITQHRGFSTLLSVGSKWNSAWDPKQNVILSPWCSVSSQHISFLFMREPSRNSSIDTQLLDLSIGEPAGEWKFKCICIIHHSIIPS